MFILAHLFFRFKAQNPGFNHDFDQSMQNIAYLRFLYQCCCIDLVLTSNYSRLETKVNLSFNECNVYISTVALYQLS